MSSLTPIPEIQDDDEGGLKAGFPAVLWSQVVGIGTVASLPPLT